MIALPVCMYTGRYHPGMWTLLGILFVIALSDIVKNVIDNYFIIESNKNYFLTILILFMVLLNFIIQPFQKMSMQYKSVYESSVAAYSVINSAAKEIKIVRLPGAEELVHPIGFWIGNQIYQNNPGLTYFKEYNTLRMSGMYVENYNNYQNKNFTFIESLLNNQSSNFSTLFKNRNTFFMHIKDELNGKIYSASSIPESPSDYYEVYLPQYIKNLPFGNKLRIDLILDQPVTISDKLIYGGKPVFNFTATGNKVSFFTDDRSSHNRLSMMSALTENPILIKQIEIFSPEYLGHNMQIDSPTITNYPSISTGLIPCNFELRSPTVDIYASLASMENLEIHTLYPISRIWPYFVMSYWSFDTNRSRRLYKSNLKFNGNFGAINYCN
jgi:hypothetical protein